MTWVVESGEASDATSRQGATSVAVEPQQSPPVKRETAAWRADEAGRPDFGNVAAKNARRSAGTASGPGVIIEHLPTPTSAAPRGQMFKIAFLGKIDFQLDSVMVRTVEGDATRKTGANPRRWT